MKVLVIEDNKADQRLLQEMFRDMNMPAFELVFAENLTKGIAYLDSEDIGIVILDLGLPESQGLDTFLRLKPHAENVSVIVLTGLDDTGIARNSLKEGAQDYLIKGWISTEILKKSIIYAIERQRLIEELRQSNREILFREERFRTLIENNADAMVVLSKTEGVQYQNPAAELLFEGAPADYLKIPSFSQFEGGKSIERPLDFHSGIQKIIEMRGVPIEWERLPAFLLTIRDITDRKRMEEALQRKTRAYRVISEFNQFLVRSQDVQELIEGICNIIVTSGGYRSAWVGYARNDKDRTVDPVAWSGLEKEYFRNIQISWKKGRGGNGPTGTAIRTGNINIIRDIPHNPKCGSWVPEAIRLDYATVAAIPLKIKEKVIGALTIYSGDAGAFNSDEMQVLSEMTDDLAYGIETLRVRSAHEKAEQELKASEIRYRRLFEAAKDGILILNAESGKIIDANPFILNLLGHSHDSLLGKYLWEIGLLKDKSQADQAFADLKRDQYVRYEDLPLVTKDGQTKDVEFVSNIYEVGHDNVIQCNIRDITERKESDKKIESLAKFPGENPNPVIRVATDGVLIYANKSSEIILNQLGFSVGAKVPEFLEKIIKEARACGSPLELEKIVGGKTYLFTVAPIIGKDYTNIYGRDITERTRVHEALQKSEDILKRTGEIARVGGWEVDAKTLAVTWTEETYHIHGVPVGQTPTLEDAINFFNPDERSKLSDAIKRALATGEGYDMELRFITIKGEPLWTRTVCQPEVVDGKTIRLMGTFQDITKRKEAENALIESRQRILFSLESADIGSWALDLVTHEAWRSLRHDQIFGYEELLPEWTYEMFLDHVLPEDRSVVDTKFGKALEIFSDWDFESRIRRKDGAVRWIWAKGRPEYNDLNKPVKMFGIVQDITKRKEAEEEMRRSFERFRTVMDGLDALVYVVDMKTYDLLFINKYGKNVWGDIEGKICWQTLQKDLAGPCPFCTNDRLVDSNGNPTGIYEWEFQNTVTHQWYDCRDSAIRWLDGRLVRLEIATNITRHKQAEEELKHFSEELEKQVAVRTETLNKTLQEKDILFKEVHHRVKNNMQIIISLLNLQSRTIDDPVILKTIKDSQSRIKAMALVHERLYQSGDISRIDLKDYIQFLARELFSFYGVKSQLVRITINSPVINVNIDTAIPLGLMVNELISNAIKHAFPEDRRGEIVIDISKDKNEISLVVRDNGVGIPADFDWHNAKSLGIRLVNSLVEQLQGTIEMDRTAGTAFTIVVKEKE